MKIVADVQLAGVSTLFADLGQLLLVPAEEISAGLLVDADALLVRSVTPVNDALLRDSPVRFVGTATSGTDHIDTACLERRGITLAAAAGSNANAVVDYCMTALAATLAPANPSRFTVGVAGYGHIGAALAARLAHLGFAVRVCDPPLAGRGESVAPGGDGFVSLTDLADCAIVSLHVPLSHGGEHATAGMINSAFIDALAPGTLLLNTCRGGVVDEAALLRRLEKRGDIRYVADVWQGEPNPAPALVAAAELATPHIAGYSRRAKLEATRRLQQQFCRHFALPGGHDRLYEEVEAMEPASLDSWQVLLEALPLPRLSNRFRQAVAAGQAEPAFATLRQQMLQRREFCELALPAERLTTALAVHGFRKV